jgi:hypothetical protein
MKMFHIPVQNDVVNYTKNLLTKFNFARRCVTDDNYEDQLAVLIGQFTIQKILGFPSPNYMKGQNYLKKAQKNSDQMGHISGQKSICTKYKIKN